MNTYRGPVPMPPTPELRDLANAAREHAAQGTARGDELGTLIVVAVLLAVALLHCYCNT